MKHLLFLWAVCILTACQNNPETNTKGDRVHLVVTPGNTQNGSWEKISAPMTWWIDIHGDEELYRKISKEFTREQLISFAASTYLSDVVKEGHQWFFLNTASTIRNDVLDGLKAVGLQKHTDIYQRAILKFEETKDREADFTEEDTGIILLRENEDVEGFFRAYAKSNSGKFYYDQWVKKPK
jgi:hypothetical protein